MALNAAQIARRTGKITGSRIACLMNGDQAKIMRMYKEFIGEEVPEDLSDVWPVQLGTATEEVNINWYERKHRQAISRRGDFVTHPFLDWAGVTLDGWIDELQCVIEAKHCGGREPMEVLIERYQPQCQWAMEVTGADVCALSIILGASEPVVEFLERDVGYAAEMRRRGAQFIAAVKMHHPPVELDPVPAPADASVIYDMSQSNSWGSSAVTWLETGQAARDHDDAAKVLKSLVPPDAKRCHGFGVQITRSKVGSLSLRELRE